MVGLVAVLVVERDEDGVRARHILLGLAALEVLHLHLEQVDPLLLLGRQPLARPTQQVLARTLEVELGAQAGLGVGVAPRRTVADVGCECKAGFS